MAADKLELPFVWQVALAHKGKNLEQEWAVW
jgi:hypothetical protein